MPTLYMTIGLPASGKSTWAREKVAASGGRCVRVNKDTLRGMLDDGTWSPAREDRIIAARDALVREYLSKNISVVVDDTNFAPKHRETLSRIAKELGADFVVEDKFLEVPVHECVRRDAARSVGHVGEYVIRDMWRRYLCRPAPAPIPFERKNGIYYGLDVVLCDLDGTIALLNGRSPYSLNVRNDLPNKKVIDIMSWTCNNAHLDKVFLSGRSEAARADTESWLKEYVYEYEALFMRPEGDKRPDWQVKREIYEREILGRFNVYCVFDDRDQVVDLWRSLGLTCFQVADGAF